MTELIKSVMELTFSVTENTFSVTELVKSALEVPFSVTEKGTSVADFGVFLSLFRTKNATQATAPVKKPQCTVNGFPLSAEFIFNRNGAAIFAH